MRGQPYQQPQAQQQRQLFVPTLSHLHPPARWSWITSRPPTRPLLLAVMPSAERGTPSRPTASCTASLTSRGKRKIWRMGKQRGRLAHISRLCLG